jgi:hypothetical protein
VLHKKSREEIERKDMMMMVMMMICLGEGIIKKLMLLEKLYLHRWNMLGVAAFLLHYIEPFSDEPRYITALRPCVIFNGEMGGAELERGLFHKSFSVMQSCSTLLACRHLT